jgi:hypothetical protein
MKDIKIDFRDFPTIIWDKKFDEDPDALRSLVQHISDYMLLGVGWSPGNKKTDETLKKVFNGDTKNLSDLYKEVTSPFAGMTGSSKVNDYKFYRKVFQSFNGTILGMPFRVTSKNVSQASVDEKIKKDASAMAAMLRNKAAAALQEDGQDYSFMRNEEVQTPSTIDKLLEQMNAPQQEEYAVTRLLMNLHERQDTSGEELLVNQEHFIYGRMYGYIDYFDGDPKFRFVSSEDFSCITPVPVRDMDDPNISAWSVRSFISLDNALRIYGHNFASKSSAEYLRKTIVGIREGKKLKYHPSIYNGGAYGFYSDPFSGPIAMPETELSQDGRNYQPMFYQAQKGVYAFGQPAISLLEHKIFFKVVKQVKSKLLLDGKNPTSSQVNEYERYPSKFKATFVPVEDDYVPKSGEYMMFHPKEELMEAVRLGHCSYPIIRKSEYQTKYEKSINRVKSPCIGFVSDEESVVSLGMHLSVFYNSFMYKAQELRNIAGPDDILLLDELQMDKKKWAAGLHSASTTGTMWFNSGKVQDRSNSTSKAHMSRVQLTPKVESILKYFQAALDIERIWEGLVGKLSTPSPYDSAQKVNQMLEQNNLLTRKYFWEHHRFMTMMVRRWADIVKVYFAEDKEISQVWQSGLTDVLKLSKKMSMYDYETYLEVGMKAVQDKEFIMAKADAAVSSGQLGFLDMVQIYLGDNLQESVARIKMAAEDMKEANQQMQEGQQQLMAQKNQIDAEKGIKLPLALKDKDFESTKYVADLRYQSQTASLENKQNKSDIDAQNRREEMLLQAQTQGQLQSQAEENQLVIEKNRTDSAKSKTE